MNIAVTGFYGTGSSAVIDLLSEYEGVKCAVGRRYEHSFLYFKGCLLDLENRIFGKNANCMIIDDAFTAFKEEMKRQNDYDFGWYGSYKRLYGKGFSDIVDTFLSEVSTTRNLKTVTHAKGVRFSLVKCVMQLGALILKKRKVTKWGRVYVYEKKPMRFLTVSHDEFMRAAKKFVAGYLDLCKADEYTVYDHMLRPEQALAADEFFGDDFKLIIVDRDPRDIYISANYIWSQVRFGLQNGPFPKGVDAFCFQWKLSHEILGKINSDKVIVVKFEDLVYKYEETVAALEKKLNLSPERHVAPKSCFNPQESINNTQVYGLCDEYKKEVETIENELKEFIYEFPYNHQTSEDKIFDN